MPKKPSGLGRGLGDLLDDNTPEIRAGKSVVIRSEGGSIQMTPESFPSDISESKPKSLYEELPKNRSIKANFKK